MSPLPCTLIVPLRQIPVPKKLEEDYELIFPSYSIYLPRYITNVQIIEPSGDFPILRAIIDTGASISLLNVSQLAALASDTLPYTLKGLKHGTEYQIPTQLFPVSLCIFDEQNNRTPPLQVMVAVSDLPGCPNILGMLDLLEKFKIHIDPDLAIMFLTLQEDNNNH